MMSCLGCGAPDAETFYVGAARLRLDLCDTCQVAVVMVKRLGVAPRLEFPDDAQAARVLQAAVNVVWQDVREAVCGHALTRLDGVPLEVRHRNILKAFLAP